MFCITEALVVDYFAFAEEFYGIAHIGVVNQTKDIVIGCASLLLCCNGKSATFANKINPIGFILYHILPLAKYITKNSNVLLSERP